MKRQKRCNLYPLQNVKCYMYHTTYQTMRNIVNIHLHIQNKTETVSKPPKNEDHTMNDSDNIPSSNEQQADATDDMPVEGTQAESTVNETMNNTNDICSSNEQETDDMPKENQSKETVIKERCPMCKKHLIQLEIIIFILA